MNTIIQGESTHILSTYPQHCIDLVVTDPPYLCNYKDRSGRSLMNDDNPAAVLSVFHEIYRVMKPHSYFISFYGWNAIAEFSNTWKDAGFRTVGHIVWPKRYVSRARHTQYCHESAFVLVKGNPPLPANPLIDVQPWEYSGNRQHPTQKAVSVIEPLIQAYSSPGDVVLDPFLGSETTAVAAALNNRRYIGIELEQRYCDLAEQRLANIVHSSTCPQAA